MNKTAIIIGTSRGIGHALTIKLASLEVTVIAISRNTKALQDLKRPFQVRSATVS